MAINYSDLVDLVISKTGNAQPVSGGDDPVSDDEVIEYLNDAFSHMTKKLGGHEKYVRFTITAAGVITVTVPASGGPTIALVDPALLSYPSYSISDAYHISLIENMSDAQIDSDQRVLYSVSADTRGYANTLENSDEYYRWVDEQARRGFVLLPKTITVENDIAITYGGKFIRYDVGAVSRTTGTGLSDLTISEIFTGSTTTEYAIKITTAGAQDKYRLSTDGGATYPGAEIDCAVTAVTLDSGLSITFGAITGHTLNDVFEFTATAPSLSYYEDEEMREYPVEYAAAMTMKDLKYIEWQESFGYAQSLLRKFLRDREGESSDMIGSLKF